MTLHRKPWWCQQRGCWDLYSVTYISLWSILQWIPCLAPPPPPPLPALSNTTLILRYCPIKKMGIQPVQDDFGKDLACNTQKGDPTVVLAAGRVTFAFVQVHYSGIFQILGGKHPSSQHVQFNSVNVCVSVRPPALKPWGGMPSGPAYFPHCNSSVVSLSSSSVGVSLSSRCKVLAGISSITLRSTSEVLLRSCLTCSDHLLFIASLSVTYRLAGR